MSKHILASDYDGTLKRNGTVSEEDLAAIRKFRSEGNLFGLITGRAIAMLTKELRDYQIPFDFIAANNSAIIVDEKLNCMVSSNMNLTKAMELIENFPREGRMLGFSNGYEHIRLCRIPGPNGVSIQPVMEDRVYTYDQVLTRGCINSVFFRGVSNEDSLRLVKEYTEKYGEYISFHYNNGPVDAIASGVSKVTGMQWMQKHYPNMEVHVIGDGYNDVDMLKAFDSFAVENAVEPAKKAANKVVGSIQEAIEILLEK